MLMSKIDGFLLPQQVITKNKIKKKNSNYHKINTFITLLRMQNYN